ncbi:hypothetical protein NP493_1133g00024 [Ridgeia piscesae]|uniref:Autophagy-related protein 13 n=1 Tax=Ridgeia piscesae TaxID=27915 RepID=A0AAD9KGD4_RIDPI|nr:hypothetical protein NP493_1133g00024 [Ridgeia piscesae]
MAAPKGLSGHDRKDLDKFTKYLIYKCIQVIVQSRLGEKVVTQSKPVSSGSDWFHLAIQDIPEVLSEAKKTFTCTSLMVGQHVCIEISLKTAEGENMILENWSITKDEKCDTNARVSYTVYNRMSILLKSLFSVSRVTPAYQLSRKQGVDSYVICYRIYMGEPQISHLGNGALKVRVGAVPTPTGTITLSVAYRTKLLISPQHSMNTDLWGVEFKHDHFMSDFSPRRPCKLSSRDQNCRCNIDDNAAYSEQSQELCATTFSSSPQDAPLLSGTSPGANYWPNDTTQKPGSGNNTPNKNSGPVNLNVFGAFVSRTETEAEITKSDDLPFGNLLRQVEKTQHVDANANKQVAAPADEEMPTGNGDLSNGHAATNSDMTSSRESGASKSSASQASGTEDFVMVELKTPFAGADCNSDLGQFYRECQGAPPLCMFNDNTSFCETLDSVTEQLSLFDARAKDFDDFVNSLQCPETEAQ